MRFLVLCCIGFFLAGCGGVSQQTAPSRASVRGQQPPTVAGTTWAWSNGNGVEFLKQFARQRSSIVREHVNRLMPGVAAP